METVTLRTGHEHAAALVNITTLALRSLMARYPIAFYELVCKCRDRDHKLFGNVAEVLSPLSLLQPDGRVHGAIREIVLASVEGDGMEMKLRSPIAPTTGVSPTKADEGTTDGSAK